MLDLIEQNRSELDELCRKYHVKTLELFGSAADGGFDLDACRAWFTDRGVTRFKTPEQVIVLDQLPTMAAGKPDRDALRELARRA